MLMNYFPFKTNLISKKVLTNIHITQYFFSFGCTYKILSYSLCEQIQDLTNISLLCRWSLENNEGRESSKSSFGTGNISLALDFQKLTLTQGLRLGLRAQCIF